MARETYDELKARAADQAVTIDSLKRALAASMAERETLAGAIQIKQRIDREEEKRKQQELEF